MKNWRENEVILLNRMKPIGCEFGHTVEQEIPKGHWGSVDAQYKTRKEIHLQNRELLRN